MGRKVKIIILTGLLLSAVAALYGQRGMRWRADTSSVTRPGREMRMRQLPAVKNIPDSLYKYIRPGYWHGYGRIMPFDHGMWNIPYRRFPDMFCPGCFFGPQRIPLPEPFRYGRRDFIRPGPAPKRQPLPYLYRIPDLTDKQKKEIESLREKFRDEMNKFREENRRKIEEMRKSHLDKIKNLLTPEQKKWLEDRIPPASENKKI